MQLHDRLWEFLYGLNLVPYVVGEGNARWLCTVLLPLVAVFLSLYFSLLRTTDERPTFLCFWKRRAWFEWAATASMIGCTALWFSVLNINGEGVNMATLATVGDKRGAANGINSIFLANIFKQAWRSIIYCGLWEVVAASLLWAWNKAQQRRRTSAKNEDDTEFKDPAAKKKLHRPEPGLGLKQRAVLALANVLVALVSHPLAIQFVLATATLVKPIAKRRVAYISPAFPLAYNNLDHGALLDGSVVALSATGQPLELAPYLHSTQQAVAVKAATGDKGGKAELEKGHFLAERYIHRPQWDVYKSKKEYLAAAIPGVFSDEVHAFSSTRTTHKADRSLGSLKDTSKQQEDEAAGPPPPPPNIVIVFAEGLDRFSSNSNGHTGFPGLMPNLMQLETESLSFSNLAVPFGTGWSFAAKTAFFCGHAYTMPRQEDIDAVYPSLLKEDHHWLIEDEKLIRRDLVAEHEQAIKNGSWAANGKPSRTPFPTPVPSFVPRPAPKVPENWFHRSFSDVVSSYIPGSTCAGDILASTYGYYSEFMTGCTTGFAGVGRLFQDHGFQSFVDKNVNCPSQKIWPANGKQLGWGWSDADVFTAARSRIDALKRARKGDLPFASNVAGSGGGLNHSFQIKTYNKLLGQETPPALPFESATHPLTKKLYPQKDRPFMLVLETADMHDGEWSHVCEDMGLINFGLKEMEEEEKQAGLRLKNNNNRTVLNGKPSALKQALRLGSYTDDTIVRASHCFDRLVTDFVRSVADQDTIVVVVGDHHPHNALQKDLQHDHVKRWLEENGGPSPVYPSRAVRHPEATDTRIKPGTTERHYGHTLKPTLFAAIHAPGRVLPGRMITRAGSLMDMGASLLQMAGIRFGNNDNHNKHQGNGLAFGRSLIAPVRGPQDMTLRELMAVPAPLTVPGGGESALLPCVRRAQEREKRCSSQIDPRAGELNPLGSQEMGEDFLEEWCVQEQWDELEREMDAFCFDDRSKEKMWKPRPLTDREMKMLVGTTTTSSSASSIGSK
jgi:Sulfatase